MASLTTELDPYRLSDVTVTKKVVEQGAYSTLLHLDCLGLKCAGRKIHDSLTKEGDTMSKYSKECELLSKAQHPNLAQFLGVFFQEGEMTPILVTELLPTSLTVCIEKFDVLPNEIRYSILHDVALGLCYLHGKTPPIVHRHLSSNSVALTPSLTAKIADLGVARIVQNQPSIDSAFTAPEVAVGVGGETTFDPSVDVFSYGAIMIHMFSGKWPKPKIEPATPKKKARKSIPISEAKRREEYLEAIGADHPTMELTRRCIENNPQLRPRAKDIVEQTSKMTSQFPCRVSSPLDTIERLLGESEKIRALKREADEREKVVRKREEKHSLEMKELQGYLEGLRAPLIEKVGSSC